jgi:hypothetical protein
MHPSDGYQGIELINKTIPQLSNDDGKTRASLDAVTERVCTGTNQQEIARCFDNLPQEIDD